MLNHRTTDFTFAIRTLSDKYITHATKGKLYTCFIEFKKAFDSVWQAYFASYPDTTLGKNSMTWLRLSIPKYNVFWLNMVSKEVNFLITVKMSDKAASFLRCFLNASCLNEISFLLDKQNKDPILLPPNVSSLNCLFYSDDLILIHFSFGRWVTKCTSHAFQILQRSENVHQHQENKSHYFSKETEKLIKGKNTEITNS